MGWSVSDFVLKGLMGRYAGERDANDSAENMGPVEILQKFGDYIAGLGTQPVTLPVREIVLEMLESYQTVTHNLEPFSWITHTTKLDTGMEGLIAVVSEFVRSQELFFFPENREPVLEITFSVRKWHLDCVDLEFCVSWNPVLAHFEGLSNLVTEGKDFSIKPSFSEPNNLPPEASRQLAVPTTSSFSVSIADESWLEWMH